MTIYVGMCQRPQYQITEDQRVPQNSVVSNRVFGEVGYGENAVGLGNFWGEGSEESLQRTRY